MARYINKFTEEEIISVVIAYLYDGLSHRDIQKNILHLPTPQNGGGYISMDILHYFNINGDKKGILDNTDIDNEIQSSSGELKQILLKVKAYKTEEQAISASIKSRNFNIANRSTELTTETRIRLNQNVLRKHILNIYGHKCALCDIDKDDLLVCSHIKPWSIDERNRLNPKNAICLCALHDKLFDKGYFSLNENYDIIFGSKADTTIKNLFANLSFTRPITDSPDVNLLKFHFDMICNS
ncbi:HNH endonuclease [Clostridium sp. 19966]|uniref:HNH endonuclease n=1 Tax=Clostridium sp. 19966 TaxID=2768166 RepID=UPI0028E08578|nr:HNH endonuclease [Clostridium sp. 19966]MDT8717632.1 HNH endonuclease [Clostridium sp. 19966]